MKLENILYGMIGLLAGLIIGFFGANSINRSALSQASSVAGPSNSVSNPALPPDHPPVGTSGDPKQTGAGAPEVMAAIEKARASPQDYQAQMTAADLYYQIQRFDDAARFYEAAAKLKPGDTEALIKAGDSYFDAGGTAKQNGDNATANKNFGEAEKWYLAALAKDPKNITVRNDLGLSFYLREPADLDRAIKEYKAALNQDPDHEMALQNLAIAYGEKGDSANQRATIEKLRAVNPNNPILTRPQK
jgi:tetratricopeptide (TPR) repeat protein